MDGGTPAYRTLAPGITDGSDVRELNRNLARLGFDSDGIVVDDVWQPATTVGVELFQQSLLGDAPRRWNSFVRTDRVSARAAARGDGRRHARRRRRWWWRRRLGQLGDTGERHDCAGAPAPEFISLTTSTTTSPSDTSTAPASQRRRPPRPAPRSRPRRRPRPRPRPGRPVPAAPAGLKPGGRTPRHAWRVG